MHSPALTAGQHAAEADRLLQAARAPIFTGWPTGFSERRDAVALAQLHATMAVYLTLAGQPEGGAAEPSESTP